jgi:hypothetical protein
MQTAHFSISARSGLAMARTKNRYQRQSGSTRMVRLRDDLLKC